MPSKPRPTARRPPYAHDSLTPSKRGRRATQLSSGVPPLLGRIFPSRVWKVHAVKDLRVLNGRREWLIGWAGADGQRNAWPDTWEPSNHFSRDLIDDFLLDRKERLLRVVSVDARPLDSLVQRKISHAVSNELSCVESFGRVHEISIDAPHLGASSKNLLKTDAYKNRVITYVVYGVSKLQFSRMFSIWCVILNSLQPRLLLQ